MYIQLLGNPGILGQGYGCELILGCARDSPVLLGTLGYLDRGMAVSCCMPSRDVPGIVMGY